MQAVLTLPKFSAERGCLRCVHAVAHSCQPQWHEMCRPHLVPRRALLCSLIRAGRFSSAEEATSVARPRVLLSSTSAAEENHTLRTPKRLLASRAEGRSSTSCFRSKLQVALLAPLPLRFLLRRCSRREAPLGLPNWPRPSGTFPFDGCPKEIYSTYNQL